MSVDRALGATVCKILGYTRDLRLVTAENRNILFIRPGGIGDAVLLTPVIRQLRNMYPDCSIDILAEKRNYSVFHMLPGIRTVYCYDSLWGLVKVLHTKYDTVIDSEQWYRLSAVVARLIRSPLKIGFATNERSQLFTHPVAYYQEDFELENFQRLLQPLGIIPEQPQTPFLVVSKSDFCQVSELIGDRGGVPYVVIFPGSSVFEKCWDSDKFHGLAVLIRALGLDVVVVGGMSEREAGYVIADAGAINLVEQTTLKETAAVVAGASIVISTDSGVMHIAAALGIPTVSLFGPSSSVKWAPRGDTHLIVARQLSCSPCSRYGTVPSCHFNVHCMKKISVDEVFNAVCMLLNKTGVSSNCIKI